jgi:hypothetical protein
MENDQDTNKSTALTVLRPQYLTEGKYTTIMPLPDKIFCLVGLVVVHWGTFETEMDKVIQGILLAVKKEVDGWERQAFSKRKSLFVDLVKAHIATAYPIAATQYRELLGSAADLQWRRNLVSHGVYRVTFPPAGPESPFFWAEGIHKGKPISLQINEETLDKLWHDIAHLTGGLLATVSLHGKVGGEWPMTFSDTEILQSYRDRTPLQIANLSKLAPQS